MISDRKMFKGALIAVFLMVIVEQSLLQIAGAIIKEDNDRIMVFIDEISKDAGEIPAEPTCRTYRIFGIYSYKMCLETETRNGARPVRVQFPAGFLTLIPRMYPDRYIFDGRHVAVLNADGSLEFLGI